MQIANKSGESFLTITRESPKLGELMSLGAFSSTKNRVLINEVRAFQPAGFTVKGHQRQLAYSTTEPKV